MTLSTTLPLTHLTPLLFFLLFSLSHQPNVVLMISDLCLSSCSEDDILKELEELSLETQGGKGKVSKRTWLL